jgi:3,4-dihydroxy 2-butanone 4-phosphate synthase
MEEVVERAIKDFRRGKAVLLFDWPNRENEVDLVYYAGLINHSKVYELRVNAGGMICFGTDKEVAKSINLLPIAELLRLHGFNELVNKKPCYGDASPFAIWVNSIDVRTGISDIDRAKTILKLHEVVSAISNGEKEKGRELFYKEFYAPGHVPILIANDIKFRRGHTELAVLLANLAGLKPSVVYAEMLDYGTSMSFKKAKRYAEEKGLTLISGDELLSIAKRWCR